MTPLAQNIAIAEACGLKAFGADGIRRAIPNYVEDRNAMNEALQLMFDDRDRANLVRQLSPNLWTLLTTPTAEIAEAFLRTLNLWDPNK